MRQRDITAWLLVLFAAGWLLFGFPLLKLWLARPAVLFVVWGLVIAALAWLMERQRE
jgi:hypothetical protein